jgi:precorrin-2 dehydrogenase/sirohydrochlorin ferrochelatase
MNQPVLLNLTGRLALVVGGGGVGRRRARALLDAGARVRLVCLEARSADLADPGLDWLTEGYQPGHLAGAAIVCAAGPPELNARVVADAKERGVWVNSATDPGSADFVFPAVVRRGPLVLAVATGGAAPALAAAIARKLEEQFDETFADWVALLAELRPLVRQAVADPQRRRAVYERLCDWGWLERLRLEGKERVRQALVEQVSNLL